MNISFNGTVRVLSTSGEEISKRQTSVDEDIKFLDNLDPDVRSKSYYDTEKGEYGVYTCDRNYIYTGKRIIKSNEDGDTLLIVSKNKPDGTVEETTLSNKEINTLLDQPNEQIVPDNFKGIVLDKASSILYHLVQKAVLPEKAETFVRNVSKEAQQTNYHKLAAWALQF